MRAIPRLTTHFILLPAALAALACSESVESTDIRTTGIYPEIEVVADGSGDSQVTVYLKVGGDDSNTFLDLKGEDTLEVTVAGETKTMDQSGDKYQASFAVDAEGTEFTIAFLRGEDDDDAPASTVVMPAPFEMMLGATEVSRAADDLEYTWDPPGDGGSLSWHLNGQCVKLNAGTTPDDGTNTIAAGDIETFESDKDKTCSVALELSRSQSGDIDPAFTEGGSIVAKHIRNDSFTSTP
ncbi:MAG TPA: hypothetical protein VJN18_02075 [Polyangiaceae bacterium]|nr:hypothetical protein [Polyangiaceae bacterium]